jgi:putative addiction module component (TIGR02574 family)
MKMLADVAKDALELPPAQRLTLARILLDLSEPEQDFSPEVEAAWETEIGRRMNAVKAGEARSKSFDQVFADLDRRFPS